VHTSPTAPLVLRIGKCAMKKISINCQLRNKLFLLVIFNFPILKAVMNAPHRCKFRKDYLTDINHGAMVLTKRLHFFVFQLPKAEERPL
jgi:hypothetical protein